ncbi:hypothetical protein ACQR1I_22885 [Bradyrhizobium sp. HKCCYLS2038]|uniref:hypothetical protein n=1 Tax=unclassified Bradyrhizobium TaxID=2631580 RepID=UPI003EBC03E6
MEEDMSFVEGCYRLEGGEWEVFVITHSRKGSKEPGVWKGLKWKSGVTGLNAVVPESTKLNKSSVLKVLSDALGVRDWSEVQGPDSIKLR